VGCVVVVAIVACEYVVIDMVMVTIVICMINVRLLCVDLLIGWVRRREFPSAIRNPNLQRTPQPEDA